MADTSIYLLAPLGQELDCAAIYGYLAESDLDILAISEMRSIVDDCPDFVQEIPVSSSCGRVLQRLWQQGDGFSFDINIEERAVIVDAGHESGCCYLSVEWSESLFAQLPDQEYRALESLIHLLSKLLSPTLVLKTRGEDLLWIPGHVIIPDTSVADVSDDALESAELLSAASGVESIGDWKLVLTSEECPLRLRHIAEMHKSDVAGVRALQFSFRLKK